MEVCIYDRIVYIVKKGINIFFKKGVFQGSTMLPRGAQKMCPPYTNALVRPRFKGTVVNWISHARQGRRFNLWTILSPYSKKEEPGSFLVRRIKNIRREEYFQYFLFQSVLLYCKYNLYENMFIWQVSNQHISGLYNIQYIIQRRRLNLIKF